MSEQDVRSHEDRRFAAMVAGDSAALDQLLGDDLIYTHSSASLDSKASLVDGIKTGKFAYRNITRQDEKIRLYGESAVVTGRAVIELAARTLNVRYVDVWVKRGSGWQMVAWQSTLIPQG